MNDEMYDKLNEVSNKLLLMQHTMIQKMEIYEKQQEILSEKLENIISEIHGNGVEGINEKIRNLENLNLREYTKKVDTLHLLSKVIYFVTGGGVTVMLSIILLRVWELMKG